MILKIKIITRDSLNLEKFKKEDFTIELQKLLNIKEKEKTYKKRTTRKITSLKSPNGHKDAQHTFELSSHTCNNYVRSNQISKLLYYYKQFFYKITPDAKIMLIIKTTEKQAHIAGKKFLKLYKNSISKDKDILKNLKFLSYIGKSFFFF